MGALSFSDGVARLCVKAKPNTNRKRAMRVVGIGDGKQAVEVCISEAPEDGKANRAIIEQLAQALHVKQKQITIKSGSSGRIKFIEIADINLDAEEFIKSWMRALSVRTD